MRLLNNAFINTYYWNYWSWVQLLQGTAFFFISFLLYKLFLTSPCRGITKGGEISNAQKSVFIPKLFSPPGKK